MDELDDLLETERAALIEGDIEGVATLTERKEALIGGLDRAAVGPGELGGLRDKLDRNQALLESALLGIRRVATRIAALKRIRDSLETYDREGRRRTIPGELSRQMEKRA
ncbi:hypothetical protein K1T73_01435 [Roseovarius sp. SCSIO 43702]|nr:hypothetical protein K1T73_01435 [Roseovarius sp. SCSIO 43702]